MKRILPIFVIVALVIITLVVILNNNKKNELFIYNWSDYIAEDTIANFEAETGIDVTYDVFDSNEVLEAKLLAGKSGYDIVVPSGSFLENQIKAGVFQKLDKSKLSNLSNLDPSVLAKTDAHDPGGQYSVNYMYGTTGIGYNVAAVEERGGDVESWDIIFNPDEISKYADCGVAMLDAPSEIVEIALNYLGYNPNTEDSKANEEALELLKQIRPYIRYFDSSQYIDDLANGEICLAVGWSGDVFIAAYEEIEEVWFSIPNEGTVIWFDMMGIPADAKNVDNAHKFIDYILRPEVVADITNYVWYSNPNLVANTTEGLIDPEILEDPAIYPTEETLSKLFADTADTPEKSRITSNVFNSFKASQ
jgi:putrescine transport system substrate-binding protein